jgi:hypothetical protein
MILLLHHERNIKMKGNVKTRKAFRKAICLILICALCLSLSIFGSYAAPGDNPTLDRTKLSMLLGGSLETLTVIDAPEGAAITWASDDLRVARVSNGKVISGSEGTANITAVVGGTTLTCAVTVYRDELLVANDVFIKDTDGNPIYAQSGSIYRYKEGEPYYWYGVKFGAAERYFDSLKTGPGTPGVSGGVPSSIVCYSSYNLVDWEYEGVMCTGGQASEPGQASWPTGWFARIGVVYHEGSDTYVLVGQGNGAVAFGRSSTPTGSFEYMGTDTVNDKLPDPAATARTGDQTIYFDNRTGKAYVIYCNDGVDGLTGYTQDLWHTLPERGEVFIAELSEADGYLKIGTAHKIYDTKEDAYYNLRREGGREANCLFYYNGWYYNVGSGLAGWNVSPNFYMGGAKDPMDKTYVNEVGLPNNMTPMRGSTSNFSHSSQVVGFTTLDTPVTEQAPKGQLVLGFGDRWTHQLGNHTGGFGTGYYVFSPLSFLDPATAAPTTKEDEPKTPNPLQYKYNPDGTPNVDYYPWGDNESFYPFIPKNYPYNEWKRPEWDIPVFNSLSQFYLDIESGTWEPGPNNNYLENPEFEQDRLDKSNRGFFIDADGDGDADDEINYPVIQDYVNEPNGWKVEHIAGQTAQINYGGNRNSNARDKIWQLIAPGTEGTTDQNWYSAWAGNMTWYHGYTKRNLGTDPYKTKTYQKVDVPDGRYNLYGWVRSSGGQSEAYIYAGKHKVDISAPIGTWKLLTIEDVLVTDGQIEVGFYSDAAANQWAFFDDFAFIAAPIKKSELSALVGDAQALIMGDYAPASRAELSEAVKEALALLGDADARQTRINAAWAKLTKIIADEALWSIDDKKDTTTPPEREKDTTVPPELVLKTTDMAKASLVGSIASQKYSGKGITPVIKAAALYEATNREQILREGEDYTVAYKNNVAVGNASITVTGKGNFTGTKTFTFKIVPAQTKISSATVKYSKKFTVKWSRAVDKAGKYQIRYKQKGAKKWKTKTVAGNKLSLTIKRLKTGKAYTVQIRAAKTVGTATWYGAWSTAKTTKTVKR